MTHADCLVVRVAAAIGELPDVSVVLEVEHDPDVAGATMGAYSIGAWCPVEGCGALFTAVDGVELARHAAALGLPGPIFGLPT